CIRKVLARTPNSSRSWQRTSAAASAAGAASASSSGLAGLMRQRLPLAVIEAVEDGFAGEPEIDRAFGAEDALQARAQMQLAAVEAVALEAGGHAVGDGGADAETPQIDIIRPPLVVAFEMEEAAGGAQIDMHGVEGPAGQGPRVIDAAAILDQEDARPALERHQPVLEGGELRRAVALAGVEGEAEHGRRVGDDLE